VSLSQAIAEPDSNSRLIPMAEVLMVLAFVHHAILSEESGPPAPQVHRQKQLEHHRLCSCLRVLVVGTLSLVEDVEQLTL
jgi:hypothetical protein